MLITAAATAILVLLIGITIGDRENIYYEHGLVKLYQWFESQKLLQKINNIVKNRPALELLKRTSKRPGKWSALHEEVQELYRSQLEKQIRGLSLCEFYRLVNLVNDIGEKQRATAAFLRTNDLPELHTVRDAQELFKTIRWSVNSASVADELQEWVDQFIDNSAPHAVGAVVWELLRLAKEDNGKAETSQILTILLSRAVESKVPLEGKTTRAILGYSVGHELANPAREQLQRWLTGINSLTVSGATHGLMSDSGSENCS